MTDIDAAIAKYETKIAEQRRQANSSSLDAAPSYSMHHDDQHNAEFLPSDGNTPQDKHKRVLGHGTAAAAAAAATPQPWAKSTAHSAHSAAAELVTPRSSQRLGQAVASPARSVSSSNLRASGEYVVESPTSLYDRTLRWASNRDKAVARQASEKEDCVLQDCTFRPNVSRASNPSLTPNRASRRPQASGDASSYHLHIQRQEGARRDKMEAQKRVDVDISHWAPRITAPKEFSFAQRQGHITSLRKPVYRVEGLLGEDVPKPNSPNAPKEPPTARRAKTPSQRQNVSSQHQHHHGADDIQLSDDEDLLRPSLEQELREANARIGSLTRDLHASRAKHAAYEEEIAALNGTMIGLRRELEAAKNKLRQMALATAHHTL